MNWKGSFVAPWITPATMSNVSMKIGIHTQLNKPDLYDQLYCYQLVIIIQVIPRVNMVYLLVQPILTSISSYATWFAVKFRYLHQSGRCPIPLRGITPSGAMTKAVVLV